MRDKGFGREALLLLFWRVSAETVGRLVLGAGLWDGTGWVLAGATGGLCCDVALGAESALPKVAVV